MNINEKFQFIETNCSSWLVAHTNAFYCQFSYRIDSDSKYSGFIEGESIEEVIDEVIERIKTLQKVTPKLTKQTKQIEHEIDQ